MITSIQITDAPDLDMSHMKVFWWVIRVLRGSRDRVYLDEAISLITHGLVKE